MFAVWDYAFSPPQGDPFVEIIAQGLWPELRSDHELLYVGEGLGGIDSSAHWTILATSPFRPI